MARSNRKSSGSKSAGSTLFAMLTGLIIGLALAAAVAIFVTRVPMPFVDHASREPSQTALLPDVKDAPDPNLGLYGKDGAAGIVQSGPQNTTPLPLPGNTPQSAATPAAPAAHDNISKLIATLTSNAKVPPDKPMAPAAAPGVPAASSSRSHAVAAADVKSATAPDTRPSAAPKAAPPASTQTIYYLQAGAFRSSSEAEAVKAQILLLGLPVVVQKTQVNGVTINRVRVGPFKGIDQMNRSRSRLGEENIASTVMRQQ